MKLYIEANGCLRTSSSRFYNKHRKRFHEGLRERKIGSQEHFQQLFHGWQNNWIYNHGVHNFDYSRLYTKRHNNTAVITYQQLGLKFFFQKIATTSFTEIVPR